MINQPKLANIEIKGRRSNTITMRTTHIFYAVFLTFVLGCNDVKKIKSSDQPNQVETIAVKQTAALYEDLKGNPIDLADYKGKKLLLNYWATWCRPCIEEMPAMARAQKLLEKDNYVFLFASDQSIKKIKSFKEKRQFGLNFIKFNGAHGDLQITALPVTIIYNQAGIPVERIVGGMIWDSPEMIQRLKDIE